MRKDERGSVIALSDAAGNQAGINAYYEYGIPGSGNTGLFQYTGQMWLSEIGMYYYKARIYSPTLGRFVQTDPIGYADSPNLYNYVLGDPVNLVDPLGLACGPDTWVCGKRLRMPCNKGLGQCGVPSTTPATPNGPGGPGGPGGRGNSGDPSSVDACTIVAAQPGQIEFTGTNVSGVLGLGISHTSGTFTNLRTGSTGHFVSRGVGIGLGVGVSRVSGYYGSISNFLGYSETAEAGASLFGSALNLSVFVTTNANNEVTAGGAALSLSAPLPLPSPLSKVGATATATDTTISDCRVGQKQ